ncbi:hypothetical protein [Bacillus sp. cl95]|nr:hypothetical protein [Bacillus sp. cl95]
MINRETDYTKIGFLYGHGTILRHLLLFLNQHYLTYFIKNISLEESGVV